MLSKRELERGIPVVELAICCIAIAVQVAATVIVRRSFLHREFRHDVPSWLATINAWAWIAAVVTAVLVAVLAMARSPQWVWSVLASLACMAAIALYVVGYCL